MWEIFIFLGAVGAGAAAAAAAASGLEMGLEIVEWEEEVKLATAGDVVSPFVAFVVYTNS